MPVRAIVALVAGLSVFAAPPSANAGSLEDCAQRVIRDWYADGRIDKLYPLPCYRAAIGMLPDDVLQYTDAGDDIARALERARHRQNERRASGPGEQKEPTAAAPAASGDSSERAASASPPRAPPEPRTVPPQRVPPEQIPPQRVRDRGDDNALRVASRPEPQPEGAGLPYPLIALAALGPILLASGLVAALARRRR
jgi:hypothetical protein